MKVEPIAGSFSTGDMALSSALNAMGIPPAPAGKFVPVKGNDGHDFVRISVSSVSICGKYQTGDLIRRWRGGAAAVRSHPSCPFSALQVWAKTRTALVAAKRGIVCWVGTVGPWPCAAAERDRDEWLDRGQSIELYPTASPGVSPDDPGLCAALIVMGCTPIGIGPGGNAVFRQSNISEVIGAGECLEVWPAMVANRDSPAAYFAAAAWAREMSLAAIRAADPLLLITRGKEMATIRQSSLEDKCPKAETLARKIGL